MVYFQVPCTSVHEPVNEATLAMSAGLFRELESMLPQNEDAMLVLVQTV